MKKSLGLFLAILLLSVGNTWGAGFQLFNEGSARVMGLGAAVTARSDMVESAWYNPSAAAFFSGPEMLAGMALVKPSFTYKDKSGEEYEMVKHVHPLPFFYGIFPVNNRVSLSFSFNLPYGLATDWPNDWPGRYDADYTSLKTFFWVPSISFKLNDKLSIAVGAQLVYADAEMEKALLTTTGDVRSKLEGDDYASGWLAALTFKPWKHTTFGLIYRSKIDLDLDGKVTYQNVPPNPQFLYNSTLLPAQFINGKGEVLLTLPATFSFGVATTIVPRWILSADLLWSGWSAYEKLTYKFEYLPYLGIEGTKVDEKNWHDRWAIRLGAEYALKPQWKLRFGYVYDPSPIDDYTRGPELPTSDRHLFNIGVGYLKGNLELDAAYTYLIMEETSTPPAGSPGNEYGNLDGQYDGDTHIFSVDVRYKF
ncbi:OmpP1/FadL family transporter [Thermodesulfatator indicus]